LFFSSFFPLTYIINSFPYLYYTLPLRKNKKISPCFGKRVQVIIKQVIKNKGMESYMDELIRLNKYLSDAGVCSRREADRLIEQGKITVDEQPATLGMKIVPSQKILLDGKSFSPDEEKVLLLVNKPQGIECTTQKRVKNNIVEFVSYPVRVYPVGRLDKDSEGLLLMTNEGSLVNKMMRAGNYHEKEYIVSVDRPVTGDFIRQMRQGVPILDTITRKCKVEKINSKCFRIILTQGLNRQIRRMCEYFGYRVTKLKRIRILNLTLDELPVGKYRKATQEEWEKLWTLLENSSQ